MKMIKRSALFLVFTQLLPACGQEPETDTDAGPGSTGTAGASGMGPAGTGGTAGTGGAAGTGGTGTPGKGGGPGNPDASSTGGTGGTGGGAAGTGGTVGGSGGTGGTVGGAGGAGGVAGAVRDSGPADVARADADARSQDGNADIGRPDVGAPDAACRQAAVVLGTAGNFVVLAGSTVTNSGPTALTGDLGVSAGTAVTGFPPGTIVGTQYAGDSTAAQGQADLTTAYNDAAGRTLCAVLVAGNLGGQTLTPGLYKSTSSLEISSGDLMLDAQGDSSAVFIFQMASTLTTTSGRQVTLIGSAKSTNVFWQVGTSATFGSTSSFQGTVMADQAITLTTGATLNGRALARITAVALDSNTIVKPAL